ncbi:hypothetical protein FO519_007978 [Halicephalobus sp. NKZ332]|nr:hypothetical protein FO519_007978 [Halicephalobus sp. NKZ332]
MSVGLPEVHLKEYYDKFYPSGLVLKWLKYNRPASEYLELREIAFILADDTHIRYKVILTEEEFKKELLRTLPHKIDLGAVYNHRPDKRLLHKNDFKAMERELVFDIDLTDYDAIRSCCSGASLCRSCWRWMILSVRVLEKILKNHFGFRNFLFIFSGRRGVHCWVADEAARKLDNSGRSAVAEYLSIFVGSKKVQIPEDFIHPLFEDSYNAIMESEEFDKLVIEQKWLEENNWSEVLSFCNDESWRSTLMKEFASLKTAEMRWKLLKRRFDSNYRKKTESEGGTIPEEPPIHIRNFLKQFVLQYAHPRLDVNVSTGTNHLLKSPFCVHPKTGKVAVPLNSKTIDKFNPEDVPTISKLMEELQKISSANSGDSKENKLEILSKQSSLKPYLENFEMFVNGAISS